MLSSVDLDLDDGLTIGGSVEDLGLLGGDSGVTGNELGHDTTEGLDTEREGGDIEKQDIGDVTGEDTTLDGGTNSDSLVRVDTLGRRATEDRRDGLDDTGHTSHTTN